MSDESNATPPIAQLNVDQFTALFRGDAIPVPEGDEEPPTDDSPAADDSGGSEGSGQRPVAKSDPQPAPANPPSPADPSPPSSDDHESSETIDTSGDSLSAAAPSPPSSDHPRPSETADTSGDDTVVGETPCDTIADLSSTWRRALADSSMFDGSGPADEEQPAENPTYATPDEASAAWGDKQAAAPDTRDDPTDEAPPTPDADEESETASASNFASIFDADDSERDGAVTTGEGTSESPENHSEVPTAAETPTARSAASDTGSSDAPERSDERDDTPDGGSRGRMLERVASVSPFGGEESPEDEPGEFDVTGDLEDDTIASMAEAMPDETEPLNDQISEDPADETAGEPVPADEPAEGSLEARSTSDDDSSVEESVTDAVSEDEPSQTRSNNGDEQQDDDPEAEETETTDPAREIDLSQSDELRSSVQSGWSQGFDPDEYTPRSPETLDETSFEGSSSAPEKTDPDADSDSSTDRAPTSASPDESGTDSDTSERASKEKASDVQTGESSTSKHEPEMDADTAEDGASVPEGTASGSDADEDTPVEVAPDAEAETPVSVDEDETSSKPVVAEDGKPATESSIGDEQSGTNIASTAESDDQSSSDDSESDQIEMSPGGASSTDTSETPDRPADESIGEVSSTLEAPDDEQSETETPADDDRPESQVEVASEPTESTADEEDQSQALPMDDDQPDSKIEAASESADLSADEEDHSEESATDTDIQSANLERPDDETAAGDAPTGDEVEETSSDAMESTNREWPESTETADDELPDETSSSPETTADAETDSGLDLDAPESAEPSSEVGGAEAEESEAEAAHETPSDDTDADEPSRPLDAAGSSPDKTRRPADEDLSDAATSILEAAKTTQQEEPADTESETGGGPPSDDGTTQAPPQTESTASNRPPSSVEEARPEEASGGAESDWERESTAEFDESPGDDEPLDSEVTAERDDSTGSEAGETPEAASDDTSDDETASEPAPSPEATSSPVLSESNDDRDPQAEREPEVDPDRGEPVPDTSGLDESTSVRSDESDSPWSDMANVGREITPDEASFQQHGRENTMVMSGGPAAGLDDASSGAKSSTYHASSAQSVADGSQTGGMDSTTSAGSHHPRTPDGRPSSRTADGSGGADQTTSSNRPEDPPTSDAEPDSEPNSLPRPDEFVGANSSEADPSTNTPENLSAEETSNNDSSSPQPRETTGPAAGDMSVHEEQNDDGTFSRKITSPKNPSLDKLDDSQPPDDEPAETSSESDGNLMGRRIEAEAVDDEREELGVESQSSDIAVMSAMVHDALDDTERASGRQHVGSRSSVLSAASTSRASQSEPCSVGSSSPDTGTQTRAIGSRAQEQLVGKIEAERASSSTSDTSGEDSGDTPMPSINQRIHRLYNEFVRKLNGAGLPADNLDRRRFVQRVREQRHRVLDDRDADTVEMSVQLEDGHPTIIMKPRST